MLMVLVMIVAVLKKNTRGFQFLSPLGSAHSQNIGKSIMTAFIRH